MSRCASNAGHRLLFIAGISYTSHILASSPALDGTYTNIHRVRWHRRTYQNPHLVPEVPLVHPGVIVC